MILDNLGVQNLRIYFSGENLITITNYSGYDPEASVFGQNNLNQGVDFGVYPTAKTYRFGIQVGF